MSKQRRNTKKLEQFRRELRYSMTDYEKSLWMCLRKKQLGYRFLRQYSIDNFILDFYCPKRKIAIEVDGTQHSNKENLEYDMLRTFHLEALGIKVLRFTNEEIFQNLEKVVEQIESELGQDASHPIS